MASDHRRLPAFARGLLWLRFRGARRAEIARDLEELYERRRTNDGHSQAVTRLVGDLLSLLLRPAPGAGRSQGSTVARRCLTAALEAASDSRFALRLFRRQAGVTAVAVLGLAVALATVTAAFSIHNAVNLRPLGVQDPDAVVSVWPTTGPDERVTALGWPFSSYLQLREGARTVALEASVERVVEVGDPLAGASHEAFARFVTGGLQPAFGARAQAGRVLGPTDDQPGAPPVATLTYAYWQRAMRSDPAALGSSIVINSHPVTVVGILDRESSGPFLANRRPPAILLPLAASGALAPGLGPWHGASDAEVEVVGSLLEGHTGEAASAELSGLASGMRLEPREGTSVDVTGARVRWLGNEFTADDAAMLALVLAILGFVLLLGVVNVANLLLAGATTRGLEIGTRRALGAGRSRIVRQLLAESALMAGLAGFSAWLLAEWLTPVVANLLTLPAGIDVAADPTVFLFVATVTLGVGFATGLAPARFAAGVDVIGTLKGGGIQGGTTARIGRWRATFIGLQATASIVLLVLTALTGRAFVRVATTPIPFDVDRVVRASAFAPPTATPEIENDQFWELALERVLALPGVERAALTEHPPFDSGFHPVSRTPDGRRFRVVQVRHSAEYFDIIGTRLLRGQLFTAADVRAVAPVAVISASLAEDYWPDGTALGSRLDRVSDEFADVRVVGIVADQLTRVARSSQHGAGVIHLPLDERSAARLVVRTSDRAEAVVTPLYEALASIDAARVVRVVAVSDDLEAELMGPRIFASLTAALGGLALLLAVIGVFGVTTVVVAQRRRDTGILLALGASRHDVVRRLFLQGMRPLAIGLVAGIGIALAGTRAVEFALYGGIGARDPMAFALAAVVLLAAGGVAVLIPARRASLADPASVLRNE